MPRSTDAVRTIDLRPRGAPVATYAAKVHRLCVNGQEVALDRPAVAVIDTGLNYQLPGIAARVGIALAWLLLRSQSLRCSLR